MANSSSATYTIGFVLEQTLGHITHSQNLQTNVPKDSAVNPVWGPIEWGAVGLTARIPIYRTNWTVRAGIRARRIIDRMQTQTPLDVLFIHTQVAAVLATGRMKRIPSVVSLDATPLQYDALGEHYAHERSAEWLEGQKWRLNANCFRTAQQLVTWSHWAKQGLVDEYEVPADKITVIPPGVNVDEWTRPRPRTADTAPVKILFVGGDLERKGGLLLLKAYRSLRQQRAKGETPIELHLVTRDVIPTELGVFVYNDMQPNSDRLKALFHSCDLFCLPTYGDCLPMVLSEAGAAGLPSISTPVGAIGEIVRDGETGLLVPVGDVSALAEAIRQLVDNDELRLQFGARAIETVRQSFDAERNVVRLLELLKQTADEAKSGPHQQVDRRERQRSPRF